MPSFEEKDKLLIWLRRTCSCCSKVHCGEYRYGITHPKPERTNCPHRFLSIIARRSLNKEVTLVA